MDQLMLMENPYSGFPARNPRRRHYRRNPAGVATMTRKYMLGLDYMDILGGAGGLFLSYWLPSKVIKTATTTMQKVLRTLTAFGIAIGGGYLVKMALKKDDVAKSTVLGGFAGATLDAIKTFVPSLSSRAPLPAPIDPVASTSGFRGLAGGPSPVHAYKTANEFEGMGLS